MLIKSKHKIISLVVCAALLFCSFLSLAFSADATSGDTIFVKVNNGWSTSNIYCYMWKNNGGSGNENHSWPGIEMTKVSGTDNVFTYTVTDDYTKIIFNTGQGGKQTQDLTYTGNGGDGRQQRQRRHQGRKRSSRICSHVCTCSLGEGIVAP